MNTKQRYFDKSVSVPAKAMDVFAYADNHKNFSSHMNESNWMMAGGKMTTEVDEGRSQNIGGALNKCSQELFSNLVKN